MHGRNGKRRMLNNDYGNTNSWNFNVYNNIRYVDRWRIMGDSYQQDVFLDTSTFTTKCFRHHHKQCKGNYGRCGCKCHDKV